MEQIIGELLPHAVGVALSPFPIVAVILLVTTGKSSNSLMFLLGWFAGLFGVAFGVVALEGVFADPEGGASTTSGVIELVLGLMFLVFAVYSWRSQFPKVKKTTLPGWMKALNNSTPLTSLGLGLLLAIPNPPNFALSVTAGIIIVSAGFSTREQLRAIGFYAVIGSILVALPIILYFGFRSRAEAILPDIRAWLIQENATIMLVVCSILGAKFLGDGIQILTG